MPVVIKRAVPPKPKRRGGRQKGLKPTLDPTNRALWRSSGEYFRGYKCRKDYGMRIDQCPYKKNSDKWKKWCLGWRQAHFDIKIKTLREEGKLILIGKTM